MQLFFEICKVWVIDWQINLLVDSMHYSAFLQSCPVLLDAYIMFQPEAWEVGGSRDICHLNFEWWVAFPPTLVQCCRVLLGYLTVFLICDIVFFNLNLFYIVRWLCTSVTIRSFISYFGLITFSDSLLTQHLKSVFFVTLCSWHRSFSQKNQKCKKRVLLRNNYMTASHFQELFPVFLIILMLINGNVYIALCTLFPGNTGCGAQ